MGQCGRLREIYFTKKTKISVDTISASLKNYVFVMLMEILQAKITDNKIKIN